MWGSSNRTKSSIDPEQRELIENAQKRIKQKRGLFTHFVVFLVGSLGLVFISKVLVQTEQPELLGLEWWIWIVFIWLLLLLYHAFNVFVTKRLLGPEWEKRQYERLVEKQRKRINKIEQNITADTNIATSSVKKNTPEAIKPVSNLTIIAAMDGNLGLGKDNDLVWRLPDDFKRFKQLTTGHHIIMGRKTFESLPGVLPDRIHIVITRDHDYKADNAIVVHDWDAAIAAAKSDDQPFVIGGGEIYKMALPYAKKMELTMIHHVFDVDTYFPDFKKSRWKLFSTIHHPADESHAYPFDYETWIRK